MHESKTMPDDICLTFINVLYETMSRMELFEASSNVATCKKKINTSDGMVLR